MGINREWFELRVILFILLSLCDKSHLLPLSMEASSRVHRWNTVSDMAGQDTVAASVIPRLIRWVGRLFVERSVAWDGYWYIGAAIPPLSFCWLNCWSCPAQYACAFPLVSLPLSPHHHILNNFKGIRVGCAAGHPGVIVTYDASVISANDHAQGAAAANVSLQLRPPPPILEDVVLVL